MCSFPEILSNYKEDGEFVEQMLDKFTALPLPNLYGPMPYCQSYHIKLRFAAKLLLSGQQQYTYVREDPWIFKVKNSFEAEDQLEIFY